MLLALALLLAQALGLWHTHGHAWARLAAPATSAALDHHQHGHHHGHHHGQDQRQDRGHGHGQGHDLDPTSGDPWHHEPGSIECRLLDETVSPAAPSTPPPTVCGEASPPRIATLPAAESPAERWRGQHARGPPIGV